jgi:DNA invertase Pin-like site-specific DNA recombinase
MNDNERLAYLENLISKGKQVSKDEDLYKGDSKFKSRVYLTRKEYTHYDLDKVDHTKSAKEIALDFGCAPSYAYRLKLKKMKQLGFPIESDGIKLIDPTRIRNDKKSADHDDLKTIIALYRKGCSVPKIANKTRITIKRVYAYLKANGIQLRKIKTIMTQEVIDQIPRLYKSGLDIEDIANQLNLSKATIYRYLRKNNFTFSSDRGIRADQNEIEKMIEMYLANIPIQEIVNQFNISKSTLRKYLKLSGVKLNRGTAK